MYKEQTWHIGEYVIIKKFHTHRFPGRRKKRERPTSEQVMRYNIKLREEKVQLLILENFKEHDLWVTLTYAKNYDRPKDTNEAKKIMQRFLRRLKAWYKRSGEELKWIGVTEKGKKGSFHHHLLLNRIPGLHEKIEELWLRGHPQVTGLYEEEAYRKLAEYIVKSETKDEGEFLKYSRSRNLKVSKPQERIIKSSTFVKEPKEKAGWVLLPKTLDSGVNPVTGFIYQRYIMKRVRRKKRE